MMNLTIFNDRGTPVYVLTVNNSLALTLIKSLASQMIAESPNVGRSESVVMVEGGKPSWFSIAVSQEG